MIHRWCGKFTNPLNFYEKCFDLQRSPAPSNINSLWEEGSFLSVKENKNLVNGLFLFISLNTAPKKTIGQCADNWRGERNVTKGRKNGLWLTTFKWVAQGTTSREAKWKAGLALPVHHWCFFSWRMELVLCANTEQGSDAGESGGPCCLASPLDGFNSAPSLLSRNKPVLCACLPALLFSPPLSPLALETDLRLSYINQMGTWAYAV